MAKQLIATLTTDSNGEATYNYTGVGAGETTFIAESGELESNSLTVYDILMELTVVSDKDILSYADGDTATITATLEVEGQPAPNNMIAISKYPDFFDGTYFYIPFEQGEENWEIYFGGTIQVLREDKTLYNSFSGTAYISYKAEYESVSMAQYMQESFSLSDFPEKGFICLESPTQIGSISGFDIQRLYTDNSGTVNITYESEGAGDVCLSIIAVYDSIFLQETYALRDVHFYDSMTSDSGHWNYDSGLTKSYSSDGVSITSSSDKAALCDVPLPDNFRLTLKAKSNANNDLRYCRIGNWSISNGSYSGTLRFMLFNGWPPQYYVNNNYTQPNIVEFEAEYLNGTLTLKKDGTTLITQTVTLNNQLFYLFSGASHIMIIKDVIIEEL